VTTATVSPQSAAGQSIRLAVVAAAFAPAGLFPGAARAQMTPEEHAKHHPGAAQPRSSSTVPPAGTKPGTTPGGTPATGGMGEMTKSMGDVNGEMEHMKSPGLYRCSRR
jgi:hypothetical protein